MLLLTGALLFPDQSPVQVCFCCVLVCLDGPLLLGPCQPSLLPSGRAGRSCDESEAEGSGTSPPADVFQGVQLNIDWGGGGGC